MSEPFQAFRIHREDDTVSGRLETLTLDDVTPGNVVVRVEYSGINYKDALAATGAAPIVREFPLVGGIDLAGEVISSEDARFSPGDKVVGLCGGLSETRDGGYAEIARVDGDMLVHVPQTLDTRTTMAIGTAGFTAALAVHRLEHNGQRPQAGPVLVTGATGGVGSIAVDILSARGYDVAALTGKADQRPFLEAIGASEIVNRNELTMGTRPLESARWGGAIDNLGGDVLAWLTRTTKPWGNVASIGLAASVELHTTVMPFILRSVSLLGVNMEVSAEMRAEIWQRLATDLRPRHLDRIANREVTLDALPGCFKDYLNAGVVGRTVVKIN
ncbi:MAG: oxidoreductase [Gammaproteobacteria bacterium]|nr:oxidoreductase [Gammaproteobacteria bacterium]